MRMRAAGLGAVMAGCILGGCTTDAAPDPVMEPVSAAAVPAPAPEPDSAESPPPDVWKITCFRDNAVVLEIPKVYRIYRIVDGYGMWIYETPEGVRVQGRMGKGLTCAYAPLDT
ncbi:hypothetical protein [Inquilinus sp. CAU 1745]|uniref:hypothetical protein n=1 Tax=Inquilinus sp. CAU 1745 TaxID=3140369 RepID=UPI00325B3FA7